MRHLLRAALITALLCLPNLTAAQTIFDVSGSLSQPNGPVATFSGTLTVAIESNIVMGIENWDIQIPAMGTGSTALPAFIFTPTNSSFYQLPLGSFDDPTGWNWEFAACASGSSNCTFIQLGGGNPCCYNIVRPLGGEPLGYFYGSGLPVGATYGNQTSTNYGSADIRLATAPEPSTLVLMGSGLIGVVALRRKLSRTAH